MRLPSHETGFDSADSLHPARYRDNALSAAAATGLVDFFMSQKNHLAWYLLVPHAGTGRYPAKPPGRCSTTTRRATKWQSWAGPSARDRRFESGFVQRGVSCEPDSVAILDSKRSDLRGFDHRAIHRVPAGSSCPHIER